jgi:hypothetical protein
MPPPRRPVAPASDDDDASDGAEVDLAAHRLQLDRDYTLDVPLDKKAGDDTLKQLKNQWQKSAARLAQHSANLCELAELMATSYDEDDPTWTDVRRLAPSVDGCLRRRAGL